MSDAFIPPRFLEDEYAEFRKRLHEEVEQLKSMLAGEHFSEYPASAGYELETCLIDKDCRPAPANQGFIDKLGMPEVVPELARYNIEFNGSPQTLAGPGLRRMYTQLQAWLERGQEVAHSFDLQLLMIGMLPTLRRPDLAPKNMSAPPRYRALDEGIAYLRGSPRVEVHIQGREEYRGYYDSVMAESATTSMQLHLSLPPEAAVHWYNAALVATGAVLAVSVNSPYLFGHDLWAETRVPVFAQAVDVGDLHYVTFGRSYMQSSFAEVFTENVERYPPLLAERRQEGGLEHLSLHNSYIWRWNRPIVEASGDREHPPHLRLEHRALPGGPSALDMIANAAFFYGLVKTLGEGEDKPNTLMPFRHARENFYRAARDGMNAHLYWAKEQQWPAVELADKLLLPLAHAGLAALEVDSGDRRYFLGIIADRLHRGLTGAGWQRAYVQRHGRDMQAMLAVYAENQRSGTPVSEWPL